ncbi:hypothetical protein A6302_03006 [Methylobrevis pamukkalensis]|uniref:Uncharacterized protein n=1 Tax=Methylobrevis pamukkalensis TaxID=1439726 RepID=A0A1E3H030_9HYPH|nr:hypothetical protein A6302_03006 [Methylobrevis pamukkalensis]
MATMSSSGRPPDRTVPAPASTASSTAPTGHRSATSSWSIPTPPTARLHRALPWRRTAPLSSHGIPVARTAVASEFMGSASPRTAPRLAANSGSTPTPPMRSRCRLSPWTMTAILSSAGDRAGRTATAMASMPSATMPAAWLRVPSFRSTLTRPARKDSQAPRWRPMATSSSPGHPPGRMEAAAVSLRSATTPRARRKAPNSRSTPLPPAIKRIPPSPWTMPETS